jgi:hypothetical protein
MKVLELPVKHGLVVSLLCLVEGLTWLGYIKYLRHTGYREDLVI